MATPQQHPQHSQDPQREKQQQNALMLLPGSYNLLQRASLYVGDLDPQVTETDLRNKFSPVVPVASIRLCHCSLTGKSLCYGYVNFYSQFHALKALDRLNHTDLRGKPIRIMWSQRNTFQRKSGIGNLFVKNLDRSINSAGLEGIFCHYGNVLSCRVVEENGRSKGFGFVQFDSEESAMAARTSLHDTMIEGKKIHVSKFVKKSERTAAYEELKFTNLYVKNLVKDVTEDLLQKVFSAHGNCNVVIMKDDKGRSRGFGFVNFQSPEEAKKAIQAMNGAVLGSKTLFVGRAQKKAERTEILKREYKEVFSCHFEKLKASNLYVKNLNESIDDIGLEKLFNHCGQITSAKVMRYDNGISKGFGFVCFSTPQEADLALNKLNGTFYEGRRLYVGKAQQKEDRRRQWQNYYAHCSMQSAYPSSHDIVTTEFHLYHFSFPHCPLPYHLLQQSFPFRNQPIIQQHSGANVDVQYPTQYYQPKLSSYPTAYAGYRIWDLKYGNPGSQKVGSRKKGNERSGPSES